MPPKFTPDIRRTLLKYMIKSLKVTFTGLSPSTARHSSQFQLYFGGFLIRLITPHLLLVSQKNSVCPVPFSLDVTHGIAIAFFSSAY